MAVPAPRGFLSAAGHRLEYSFEAPARADAPTFVLLHEGLGSADLWGGFRQTLARETQAGVFAYSREGYGASSPCPMPRPLDYMQQHARDVLPGVLDALGAADIVLVGHSDGGSIAACYAGGAADERLRAAVFIAPHFFAEPFALTEIARIKSAYDTADMREKLSRWHRDADMAFRGWNDAWLDPGFAAAFDISDCAQKIRVPVLSIQGGADPYGTLAQIDAADGRGPYAAPRERLILPGIGHAPHREAAQATLDAIAQFTQRIRNVPA